MVMSFPQIGPASVSDFIYALISVWVRMHELAFGMIDFAVVALFGDVWSEP